jgi:hypothetical protein
MSNTVSFSIDLQSLRDIQTKLNSGPAVFMPELDGMLHRVQDFSMSHGNLLEQFRDEFLIASIEFPKSKDTDTLMSNVSKHKEMRVYSLGSNHFTSWELAPALRHFINDSCRLLEPMTPLLAAKFQDVKPTRSLNSYIDRLILANKSLGFDSQFITELYEVWNDYKHRETRGLQTTPWKYESGAVINAKPIFPHLKKPTPKLENLDIDQLVYRTDNKILDFLNYLIK